jgi:surface antigen
MVTILVLWPMSGPSALADNWYPYCQCTWWAQEKRQDLPWFPDDPGNALNWASSARARGFATGKKPMAGALAVFQPNVQTADEEFGHVAYVESAAKDGTFRISEMGHDLDGNCEFSTGRVGKRGDGVEFIYYYKSAWRGEYYSNRTLTNYPALIREDPHISFDWSSRGPAPGLRGDSFSVRWTRSLRFAPGTYAFYAKADDGVRVWMDGKLIISGWKDQPPTRYQHTRYVKSGMHHIKVEYYEHGGDALVKFWWKRRAHSLVAVHSGQCLDVAGASRDNGANVIQWTCHRGPNQSWHLLKRGGYYEVIAKHSGKCLTVQGGSRSSGANVFQNRCHGGDQQLWRFLRVGNHYRLVAKHSGKCLDLEYGSREGGANLIQWDCHGGANQLWRKILR